MEINKELLTRRRVLGLAAAGAAAGGTALVLGTTGTAEAVTLVNRNELWDQPTYNQSTGRHAYFPYNPTFYSQAETWLFFYYARTPTGWVTPMQVWCDGVYVDKVGMHGQGRAFDLTRIYMTVNGARTQVFERYWWNQDATRRKRYWGVVASLNYHFTYVIHGLYDKIHHDHVHFDTAVSGSGLGVFRTGSRTTVLSTQAILRHIWGYATGIDGSWGPQTDGHSRDVLARLGRSGGLTTSADNWRAFNEAATLWGAGTRTGPITPI